MQQTDLQIKKEYKALEMKARRAAYQHQRWLRDKDKIKARVQKYNKEHPELLEIRRKKYYAQNKEAILRAVKEYRLKNLTKIRATASKYQKTPKGRLSMYQHSAKERGIEFNLSSDYFNQLLLENCHYCGKQNANGVDRKNSNIGYYLGNVVSCCSTCNYMKRDLSYRDFKDHITRISNNFLLPSQ